MVIDPSDLDWPSLSDEAVIALATDGIEAAVTELDRRIRTLQDAAN